MTVPPQNQAALQGYRIPEGTRIANYVIQGFLGKGGMGEVYLAVEEGISRKVALKVIDSNLVSKPQTMERFKHEAQALGRLNHPNVTTMYAAGQVEHLHFIAMEYAAGVCLHEWVRQNLLTVNELLHVFGQIMLGVMAAHEQCIIHRDLKPQNIMVAKGNQVKVIDFGIAKLIDTDNISLTQQGQFMGTVRYVAPEIVCGNNYSAQSDVYSLGVILYEFFCGPNPFVVDSEIETLQNIRSKPFVMPANARELLPQTMQDLIMRMCNRDLNLRFRSMSAAYEEFHKIQPTDFPEELQKEAVAQVSNVQELTSILQFNQGMSPLEAQFVLKIAERMETEMHGQIGAGKRTVSPTSTVAVNGSGKPPLPNQVALGQESSGTDVADLNANTVATAAVQTPDSATIAVSPNLLQRALQKFKSRRESIKHQRLRNGETSQETTLTPGGAPKLTGNEERPARPMEGIFFGIAIATAVWGTFHFYQRMGKSEQIPEPPTVAATPTKIHEDPFGLDRGPAAVQHGAVKEANLGGKSGEGPVYRFGDSFDYRLMIENKSTGRNWQSELTYNVLGVSPGKVTWGISGGSRFSTSNNPFLFSGLPTQAFRGTNNQVFQGDLYGIFPLQTGKTMLLTSGEGETFSCTVGTQEAMTTPAGSFNPFRVVCQHQQPGKETVTEVYFLDPKLQHWVRRETSGLNAKGHTVNEVYLLTNTTRKQHGKQLHQR